MRFIAIFLCFIIYGGNVYSQSFVDNVSSKYSPWSVSAFTLITQESDQMNGGLLHNYTYIGPNYRLSPTERVALRGAVNSNTSGYDRFNGRCVQQQNMELADAFLEYNNYNLGWLPGIANIYWSGRVYLPVSKSSQHQKMITRYRSSTIVSHYVTQNAFIELRNTFNYYQQSSSTYYGTHTDDNCSVVDNNGPSNTKQYKMQNWVTMWYRWNPKFSFGVQYILGNDAWNHSRNYETSRQRDGRMQDSWMSLGPVIRYQFTNSASFMLSFRDVVQYSGFYKDQQDKLQELGEFRARNTEFAFLGFYRF